MGRRLGISLDGALCALTPCLYQPTATNQSMRLVIASVVSVVLLVPVGLGLLGVALPAFGYLPVLGGDALSLAPWQALLAEPGLLTASLLSLGTGLASAALALILMTLLLAGGRTWIRRQIEGLLAPLVAVPHIALAVGLAFLLMPSGWFARLVSPWMTGWERPPGWAFPNDGGGLALVLGLVAKELPFLLLVALTALPQVGEAQRLAMARSLGYGRASAWLKAVLPDLLRRLRLPIFAVIAYGVSNVEMAIILGPSTPPTLAVLIVEWFQDPDLAKRFLGSAAALLQIGLVVLALGLWQLAAWCLGRLWQVFAADGRRSLGGPLLSWLTTLLHGPLALLTLLSLACLLLWSFAGNWRFPDALPRLDLATWLGHGQALLANSLTTLALALASTALALLLSVLALEASSRAHKPPGRGALLVLSAPLLVPQIAFLFGLAVSAAESGAIGVWPTVLWGHLLFVLPYVYLALAGPYLGLDSRYAAMAASLGKSPLLVLFQVKLPLLRAALLTAAAVGIAVSVALYLPTLLLGGGRIQTLASEAVTLSSGGDRRLLAATALAQAVIPLVALLLVGWINARRRGWAAAP